MPGLIRGAARTAVVAGTATAVSNRVSHRQSGRWAAQEAQAPAPQQYPPPGYQYSHESQVGSAQPGMSGADLAQLKELAELRDRGILTESEFQIQKARLLGG